MQITLNQPLYQEEDDALGIFSRFYKRLFHTGLLHGDKRAGLIENKRQQAGRSKHPAKERGPWFK